MIWVLGIYVLIGLLLYFFQEKMLFLPEVLPTTYQFEFSLPFEEVFLDTADGEQLNALHFTNENPEGVILYFHGNAGSLKRWGQLVQPLVDKNYDVVIMDYRGYGKSTGDFDKEDLLKDAVDWYAYAKKHYQESEITVYGRSLGTGFASYVASHHQPRQLILETPYTSISDVASSRFPIYPTKLLVRYQFESVEYLKKPEFPVTIFHGTSDEVVPYKYGKKLFNMMDSSRKQLITIPNGQHNNLSQFEQYHRGIDSILTISRGLSSD